jgi:hypothetical protein
MGSFRVYQGFSFGFKPFTSQNRQKGCLGLDYLERDITSPIGDESPLKLTESVVFDSFCVLQKVFGKPDEFMPAG